MFSNWWKNFYKKRLHNVPAHPVVLKNISATLLLAQSQRKLVFFCPRINVNERLHSLLFFRMWTTLLNHLKKQHNTCCINAAWGSIGFDKEYHKYNFKSDFDNIIIIFYLLLKYFLLLDVVVIVCFSTWYYL